MGEAETGREREGARGEKRGKGVEKERGEERRNEGKRGRERWEKQR